MNRIISTIRSLHEIMRVALILFFYLLVLLAATAIVGGAPGDWNYVLVNLLPLPLILFAFTTGHFAVRADGLSPITEATATAAGVAMALIALIDTKPGVTGTVVHLPAATLAMIAIVVSEEIILRGSLLPAFARRFGFGLAIIFSAVVFAALHMHLGFGSAVATFFAGLALGSLYVRSGLGPCIVFHTAFNLICGPFCGLSVGGLPWPGLLEPAFPRDPLDFLPVQLAFIALALLWMPYRLLKVKIQWSVNSDQ